MDRSSTLAFYPRGGWLQGNPPGVLRTALSATLLSPRVLASRANRTQTKGRLTMKTQKTPNLIALYGNMGADPEARSLEAKTITKWGLRPGDRW